MNVVFRFLAGLTQLKSIGWDVFHTTSIKFRYVEVYVIQQLYEAQNTECCAYLFDQIRMAKFQSRGLSNYDMYALGYIVSICPISWWMNLVVINDVGLQTLSDGLNSIENGRGSIDTLELVNSPLILELQIPQNILKNVLSLITVHCNISSLGYDNLVKSIPTMNKLSFLKIKEIDDRILSLQLYSQPPGSFIKLMWTLRQCQTLTTLCMSSIITQVEDVIALSGLIQSSNNLKQLRIGVGYYVADIDVSKQLLLRIVMTTSSLENVIIGIKHTQWFSIFEYIDAINNQITSLSLHDIDPGHNSFILKTHTRQCNNSFCQKKHFT